MDEKYNSAKERLKKFYPNLSVNWEHEIVPGKMVMHAHNSSDGKGYMFQLFENGSFIDYEEVGIKESKAQWKDQP